MSDMGETVLLSGGAGNPDKQRVNLLTPGFSLHFSEGIDLAIGSTSAPYISWRDGSVQQDVPTPDLRWAVISFSDAQPPIALGFLDGSASLIVTGKPGQWRLRTNKPYAGWTRFALPLGLRPMATNDAAALGRVANFAAKWKDLWTRPDPEVKKLSISSDDLSVTATWTFDEDRVLLPYPITMALVGGYPIELLSNVVEEGTATELGPATLLEGSELKVRFPVRRSPPGRSMSLGTLVSPGPATVSPIDVPSIVSLALQDLAAEQDQQGLLASRDALSEYLARADYWPEPFTRQSLPYDRAGSTLDQVAAHALLMQSLLSGGGQTDSNSLLTSLAWRRDWLTWSFLATDLNVDRRAAALAALAGAIADDPAKRLDAAMLQAGLSGRRGLEIWRRRAGLIPKEPPLLETMEGLRQGLFGLVGTLRPGADFARRLLSPVKVVSDSWVILNQRDNLLVVSWPVLEPKPSTLSILAGAETTLTEASGLSKLAIERVPSGIQANFVPESAGIAEAILGLPKGVAPPATAAPPGFSESFR